MHLGVFCIDKCRELDHDAYNVQLEIKSKSSPSFTVLNILVFPCAPYPLTNAFHHQV